MLSKYEQYTKVSFSGRKLLDQHALDEVGVWEVRGEDPNCDLGGHHHQPYLGTFSGSLGSVISMAVELPDFWQWGAGGSITKITVIEAYDVRAAKRKEIEDQIEALRKQLKEV